MRAHALTSVPHRYLVLTFLSLILQMTSTMVVDISSGLGNPEEYWRRYGDHRISEGVLSTHHGSLTETDSDGDGLPDQDETQMYGTDPVRADTDDDGLFDGLELIAFTLSPLPDQDGNGLTDHAETVFGPLPISTGGIGYA